jgi:hypothetical protein
MVLEILFQQCNKSEIVRDIVDTESPIQSLESKVYLDLILPRHVLLAHRLKNFRHVIHQCGILDMDSRYSVYSSKRLDRDKDQHTWQCIVLCRLSSMRVFLRSD